MLRKLTISNLYCFIFILFGIQFLQAQKLNLAANTPFQKCWEVTTTLSNNLASDNEAQIYLPIFPGQIKTLGVNKNENWKIDLGGEIINRPLYQNKMLYVLSKITNQARELGNIAYFISAINTNSGITEWKKEYVSEKIPIVFLQKSNLIIILAELTHSLDEQSSKFIVLDINTGQPILEKTYNFIVKQFFNGSNEDLTFLTSKNSITSFSISDGELLSFNISLKNIESGSTYEDGVLLSDNKGSLYFIDSSGKENKFKIRLGAKITHISLYNNRFLISSLDNFIYSVSADGKQINWKKRFAGRIIEKPIVEQNTVIAFSQGDNSLYFINFDDGKVFNQITVSSGEEIIDSPVLLNNFVIITTNKGIRAYSSDNCNNFTAAGK